MQDRAAPSALSFRGHSREVAATPEPIQPLTSLVPLDNKRKILAAHVVRYKCLPLLMPTYLPT